jgi:hypothetical protein
MVMRSNDVVYHPHEAASLWSLSLSLSFSEGFVITEQSISSSVFTPATMLKVGFEAGEILQMPKCAEMF